MKVLVTGAAGYVGSTLTVWLAAQGHQVVTVDSDVARLERLARFLSAGGRVDFHACTLDELTANERLFAGVQTVVHLAGISSDAAAEADPQRTWHINVSVSSALGEAAKAAGVPTFLLASTAAIYQVPRGHRFEDEILTEENDPPLAQPIGIYAQSKRAAEQALARFADRSFRLIILRKGSLYGYSPNMRWDLIINRMALLAWLGRPVMLHDRGAVWRPIAHVEDAARAYLHLIPGPRWSSVVRAFNLVERNARLSEICLEIDGAAQQELGRGIILSHGRSPFPQRTGRVEGNLLRRAGWRPTRSLRDGLHELFRRLDSQHIELPADGVPGGLVESPRPMMGAEG
jgi:nucleoside-diphosphate-sugar epimerase